jgi:hypothetical protein
MAEPGTIFQLIQEGNNHFWVVISAPRNGLVLAVNATDSRKCLDSPCHFATGEHPIITKPTAIIYRKAREFDPEKIDNEIADGKRIRGLGKLPLPLLQRIIEGARVSDDLTSRLLTYISN